jgi:hypothetical protein
LEQEEQLCRGKIMAEVDEEREVDQCAQISPKCELALSPQNDVLSPQIEAVILPADAAALSGICGRKLSEFQLKYDSAVYYFNRMASPSSYRLTKIFYGVESKQLVLPRQRSTLES